MSSDIHIAQEVVVTLKEFPNRKFRGKVARTSVALDPGTRTLRTELHIPNLDFKLTPGMYADVEFAITRTPVALIPSNALIIRGEGTQVLLIGKDKKVRYHSVKLGEDPGKQVELLSGLRTDDLVAINPSDALQEGTTVTVNQNRDP